MTTPHKALLMQALTSLEWLDRDYNTTAPPPRRELIAALQAAIDAPETEPEPEPVAWLEWDNPGGHKQLALSAQVNFGAFPVYTYPATREPLSENQILEAMPGGLIDCLSDPWDCGDGDGDETRSLKRDVIRIARTIESAHGIGAKHRTVPIANER